MAAPKCQVVAINIDTGECMVLLAFTESVKLLRQMKTDEVFRVNAKATTQTEWPSTWPGCVTQHHVSKTMGDAAVAGAMPRDVITSKQRLAFALRCEGWFKRISDLSLLPSSKLNQDHCSTLRGIVIACAETTMNKSKGTKLVVLDESGAAITVTFWMSRSIQLGTVVYCMCADNYTSTDQGATTCTLTANGSAFYSTGSIISSAPLALQQYAAEPVTLSEMIAIGTANNRSDPQVVPIMTMSELQEIHARSMMAAMAEAGIQAPAGGGEYSYASYFENGGFDAKLHRMTATGTVSLVLACIERPAYMVYNACQHPVVGKQRVCAKKVVPQSRRDPVTGRQVIDHEKMEPGTTSAHPRTDCALRFMCTMRLSEANPPAIGIDDMPRQTEFECKMGDDMGVDFFQCTANEWHNYSPADREAIIAAFKSEPALFTITIDRLANIRYIKRVVKAETAS